VLDLDECLIHSTGFSDDSQGYRQAEACRPGQVDAHEKVESFALQLYDGATCTVHKRPGLETFLRACSEEFDTVIFTAGTQDYAEPVIDHLDPERSLLKGRCYRSHCRPAMLQDDVMGTVHYLKDLTAVTDESNMARCVLVDNNPLSFVCQPHNGIRVPDFVGQPDHVLEAVLTLLRELATLQDVRPRLQQMCNFESHLAATQGVHYHNEQTWQSTWVMPPEVQGARYAPPASQQPHQHQTLMPPEMQGAGCAPPASQQPQEQRVLKDQSSRLRPCSRSHSPQEGLKKQAMPQQPGLYRQQQHPATMYGYPPTYQHWTYTSSMPACMAAQVVPALHMASVHTAADPASVMALEAPENMMIATTASAAQSAILGSLWTTRASISALGA
jgi:CTD small phosphatase-like protein 2